MADNFIEELYGENYIEHHGVKGMRWGVRRQRYTGAIGSSKRVREHQDRIRNKIKRTDNNIFARNTVNDYRRGRIAALETKARHREAKERYSANKTSSNRAALRTARAERLAKNWFFGGGKVMSMPINTIRGGYNRYRSNGEGVAKSAIKSYGKYTLGAMAVGAAVRVAVNSSQR